MSRRALIIAIMFATSLFSYPMCRADEKPIVPAEMPTKWGQLCLQTGHVGVPTDLRMTGDGRRFASLGRAEVILWDTAGGNQLMTFRPASSPRCFAMSRDGNWIACGTDDENQIVVWNAKTGQVDRIIKGCPDTINALDINDDGSTIVAGCDADSVLVWNRADGERLAELKSDNDVNHVAISGDGKIVVFPREDRKAEVWSLESNKSLWVLDGHTEEIASIAIDRTGDRIVTGGVDNQVIVWNGKTGEELAGCEGHVHDVTHVAITPDGARVVSTSQDFSTKLWDARTGKELKSFEKYEKRIDAAGLDDGAIRIVALDEEGRIIVWNGETDRIVSERKNYLGQLNNVAMGNDDSRLLVVGDDGFVMTWDLRAGIPIRRFTAASATIYGAAVARRSPRVIHGTNDASIAVRNDSTTEIERYLEQDEMNVNGIALDERGDLALSGGADNTAILWDVNSGEPRFRLQGHTSTVAGAALSANGKRGLTTSRDNSICVWNMTNGERMFTLKGHNDSANGAGINADGTRGATGGDNGVVIVWNLENGKALHKMRGHDGSVYGVAMSEDGRVVLSGGVDGHAIVWDAVEGKKRFELPHQSTVYGVALDAAGRIGYTSSNDGILRCWNLATGELLCRIVAIPNGDDWLVVAPDGRYDGTEAGMRLVTFRIPDTDRFAPREEYHAGCHTPGLLAKVLAEPTRDVPNKLDAAAKR